MSARHAMKIRKEKLVAEKNEKSFLKVFLKGWMSTGLSAMISPGKVLLPAVRCGPGIRALSWRGLPV
jgi:hypothetical protein